MAPARRPRAKSSISSVLVLAVKGTPIVEDGRIYVHFGSYGTACLDTKTGQKLWERRDLNCDHRVRPASSPIIDRDSLFLHFDGVDDLLFMVSDQGFASCLEAKTGRELWKRRLRAGGDHWASPVYADSRIYFCGKKGIVSVTAVAREFELLAENRLEASFIASAAVAGDAMILRSLTHLYCVAEANEMARHQRPSQ